jgi:hypothetical protein
MEGALFFDGQDVLLDDIDQLQSRLQSGTKLRISESFSPGIVGSITNYVTPGTTANTIKVVALTAYDSAGERIRISAVQDNLAPNASGLLTTSGGSWTNSITYAIVARHVDSDGTLVAHPVTGALNNTRRDDSFTLHALRRTGATIDTVAATDVRLATVQVSVTGTLTILTNQADPVDAGVRTTKYHTLASEKITVTVSASTATDTAAYARGSNVNLKDHVNSIGSGIPNQKNPHGLTLGDLGGASATEPLNELYQKETHSDGMYAPSGTDSLKSEVNTGATPDEVDITQVQTGDAFYLNGKRINAVQGTGSKVVGTTGSSTIRVLFDDFATPTTVNITLDETGNIERKLLTDGIDTDEILIHQAHFDGVGTVTGLTDSRLFGTSDFANLRHDVGNALAFGLALGSRAQALTYSAGILQSITASGDQLTIGAVDPVIQFNYGDGISASAELLISTVATIGNKTLTTTFTYANPLDSNSELITVTESIS